MNRRYILMIALCALCAMALTMLGVRDRIAAQGGSTPRPTRTPLPSLTPSPTIALNIPTGVAPTESPAGSQPSPTPTSPLLAPTLGPTATSPLLAASPTAFTPEPTAQLVQQGNAPLLTMKLPEGWVYAYRRLPVRGSFTEVYINVAIYRGPVSKGIGTIIVLWNYPSLVAPPTTAPIGGTPAPTSAAGDLTSQMLWTDGLRLLQGTVLDITCNVGTAGQRQFNIGGQTAVGTFFNVTQCQGEPDTAGWFAGVSPFGRGYLFYAMIEPIEAYNDARGQLQTILDTVSFIQPITATATATPSQ